MLWIPSRGRERVFREKQVDLARVAPGESVLDIGRGTGTLAIAAACRLGTTGAVRGLDPSAVLLTRCPQEGPQGKSERSPSNSEAARRCHIPTKTSLSC
jgi:ubiquinone/menaquinone biosynthesis C-methylase UbiE